ncbi:KR domain-containing protein [Candidatus Profftella armatura]
MELNSILEKDISTISNKFHDINKFDHIVWIVPVYDINNSHKNNVIIQLFRLIKVLLKEGYENIDLKITIVTIQGLFICDYDEINPHHASIHGLVSSIAQEYPMWSIKAIDMINNNVINWSVSLWYQLLGVKNISIARRKYNWFFQKLIPLNFYISKDIYRKNGIYLVIGGAGGVGSIWSEFMIKNYEAKIIWIGRSPKNNILQEKINNISIKYNGICPIYIQADARNSNILFSTYQKIKKDFDHINGIVVSTLSDYDLSFKEMSEDLFINILSTKHDVSLSIEKCFYKERLDFIIYFSSMISFEKPGGMSAYVSSCTFSDAFSKKINKKWDCVVKTINWGYWNIGGGIRISSALKKLIEKRGVESINKEEGMNILKLFLGNITEFQQLAITRTNKPEFINIYSNKEFAIVLPNNISNIEKIF